VRLAPAQASAHRLRVLMLRIFSYRPEGASTNQPRATPWDCTNQPRSCPERAKQGDAVVTPFQGLLACPDPYSQGVALGFHVRPLRGKFQNCATPKLARRVSMGPVQLLGKPLEAAQATMIMAYAIRSGKSILGRGAAMTGRAASDTRLLRRWAPGAISHA
jgi:hypothetical protein